MSNPSVLSALALPLKASSAMVQDVDRQFEKHLSLRSSGHCSKSYLSEATNKENLTVPSTADPVTGTRNMDKAESATTESTIRSNSDSRSQRKTSAFTVSTDNTGRMEALRVLILDGKKAAAEGRLAAALRNYETAMVTLPEDYKPRLQEKIAKLEAQLDDEEGRTPSRPSRRGRRFARLAESDLGPVDLLKIVVQDLNTIAGTDELGQPSGAVSSSSSSRRLSPLVHEMTAEYRALHGAAEMFDADGASSASFGEEQEGEADDEENVSGKCCGKYSSPIAAMREGRVFAENNSGVSLSPREEDSKQATPSPGDSSSVVCADHLSTSSVEPGPKTKAKQSELRAINKDLSDKLERQVVDIMNNATSNDLTDLHGIGARRAQLIVKQREIAPFTTMSDLTRIGMYPRQIEKMGKQNMLECLDVYPLKRV